MPARIWNFNCVGKTLSRLLTHISYSSDVWNWHQFQAMHNRARVRGQGLPGEGLHVRGLRNWPGRHAGRAGERGVARKKKRRRLCDPLNCHRTPPVHRLKRMRITGAWRIVTPFIYWTILVLIHFTNRLFLVIHSPSILTKALTQSCWNPFFLYPCSSQGWLM